mmetsp:Transcript_2795/g.6005  ORF Transcript_2795/g.6005 Transcript_2795/m.6005 type:complete len:92 (+) Transcript_2795:1730-2005(+)
MPSVTTSWTPYEDALYRLVTNEAYTNTSPTILANLPSGAGGANVAYPVGFPRRLQGFIASWTRLVDCCRLLAQCPDGWVLAVLNEKSCGRE